MNLQHCCQCIGPFKLNQAGWLCAYSFGLTSDISSVLVDINHLKLNIFCWLKSVAWGFIFTWIGCAQCSCHGFCPSPSLALAPCLWSCGHGLCLCPSPVLAPVLAPVLSPAPSPSRGPAALFPALALFPAPSVPVQTPAAPSPACPSPLRVSAEQNTHRFSWCHMRSGESLQSIG